MIDKHNNLLVFKNKGRPTNKKSQHIKTHCHLSRKPKESKHKLKWKERTEIPLALLVASDKLMCAVHMFPEVILIEITGNTNTQGCGLYLLMVKDPDSTTKIMNVTAILSNQRWTLKHIFVLCTTYYFEKSLCLMCTLPSLIMILRITVLLIHV